MRPLIITLTALLISATAADAAIITLTTRTLQRRAQRQERVQIGLRMMEGGAEARASVDVLAIREWMRGDLDEPFFNWPTIAVGAGESLLWGYIIYRADWLSGGNGKSGESGQRVEQNVTINIDSGNTTETDNSQHQQY